MMRTIQVIVLLVLGMGVPAMAGGDSLDLRGKMSLSAFEACMSSNGLVKDTDFTVVQAASVVDVNFVPPKVAHRDAALAVCRAERDVKDAEMLLAVEKETLATAQATLARFNIREESSAKK